MATLDALAILAAGIGRGYRGSQQIQRELALAKRKALMEEKELGLRERQVTSDELSARSLDALRSAQAGSEGAQGESLRGREKREAEASLRATALLGGPPPKGWPQGVPFTYETVDKLSPILSGEYGLERERIGVSGRLAEQGMENLFKEKHPDFYYNRGASKDPELQLLLDLMGPLTQFEAMDPDKAFSARLRFIDQFASPRLKKSLGRDSTKTGNDRFRINSSDLK